MTQETSAGTIQADGMIRTSADQAAADLRRDVAKEAADFAGTIGLALVSIDRQLQAAIHSREMATDDTEKARFAAVASRLASIMTVLESDTGISLRIIEEKQRIHFNNLKPQNAEQYGESIRKAAWRSLDLNQAIEILEAAWEREQKNDHADPEYLAKRKQAFTDARVLLLQLRSRNITVR